ncbi:hypothetical protein [Paucisalibacillus globulus]|uniref:hypothetical protein n=1 Tax=Paucisalibacillus globulus TaxID=351095 RepID=UPI000BB70AD0|nr:hypothetical protein [Paucisalibacillus globulus]
MSFEHLKYIRGYVISDKQVNIPGDNNWEYFNNNYYHFYLNPSTKWSYFEEDKSWGILIGHAIDPIDKTDNLDIILRKAIKGYQYSEDNFYSFHENLVGRFVFVLGNEKNTLIVSDATATKSIFYHPEKTIIASHAKLLKDVTNESFDPMINPQWLGAYTSHLPGHYTLYNNVHYLIPNHSMSWPNRKIQRYFPRESINYDNFEQKLDEIIENTNNQLSVLSKNNNFIFSLSAGMDSRTSLSFMKDYLDKTKFFTYYFTDSSDPTYQGSSILNLDQKVVRDISKNLSLNHTFIPIDRKDEKSDGFSEFKSILKENTFLNHSANLAKNYLNLFGTDNYLHIRSTLYEIGRPVVRTKHKFSHNEASIENLVQSYSPKALKDDNVIELMRRHDQIYNVNNQLNYDPFDLIYWEKRMGTWHSQILIQSDVSHDTHIFMNSHRLLQLMLSLPIALRRNGELFLSLIEKNWPLLRFWDINNDKTLLDKVDLAKERYGLKLDNMVIQSGNQINPEEVVPYNFKKSEKSAHFFIDKSAPKKGDFVEGVINLPINPNSGQDIVLQIRNNFENPKNKGRLKYQVILNNNILVEEDIAHWRETNQVIIPVNKLNNLCELRVRVIAIKNCEEWNWGRAGTLFIERINIRKTNSIKKVIVSSPFSKVIENKDSI